MRSFGWGGERDGLPELVLLERVRGKAWDWGDPCRKLS